MKAILTYHSIDDSGSAISVSPVTFARHVDWLASGRVHVTTLETLAMLDDGVDAVALTFDDGFENVARLAAPALRRHGLPATIFVVTDRVGRTNAWGDRVSQSIPVLPLLDWPGLLALRDDGWSIGAHTRTHCDLTALDAMAARAEIEGSLDEIAARTGARPTAFAYPFGRVSDAVATLTASLCAQACTTVMRPLMPGDEPHRLPRLDAYYFQTGGWMERWGRPEWHAYVRCRSAARRLRQLVYR
jgi:peptidoglycan/xylan/chitin deacetylase (PgdA/CDA1 family)